MLRSGSLAASILTLLSAAPAAADWPLPRARPDAGAPRGDVAPTKSDLAVPETSSKAPDATTERDRPRSDPEQTAPSPEPSGEEQARACVARLKARGADVEVATQAPAAPQCAIAAPVRLSAVGAGEGLVRLSSPIVVDCRLAETFAVWIDDIVEPLAVHHLGRVLVTVGAGSGHECRRVNRQETGKLSAHANGLAVDLFGLTLSGGETVSFKLDLLDDGHAQRRFYEALKTTACGAFTTVLGPGSDAAHADHLHVDVVRRGRGDERSGHRICQ